MEAGNSDQAQAFFLQAWNESANDLEKFTAAHYVARHQSSVQDKLTWDKTALQFALKIEDEDMMAHYPSLYLNIAKCYEDLEDYNCAEKNYQLALSYIKYLNADGYGEMIKAGIEKGLKRINKYI